MLGKVVRNFTLSRTLLVHQGAVPIECVGFAKPSLAQGFPITHVSELRISLGTTPDPSVARLRRDQFRLYTPGPMTLDKVCLRC